MPKIKDLGIKVIPETMQPLEAGGGAGCGPVTPQAQIACRLPSYCICTWQSPCLCTHYTPCGHCTFLITCTGCSLRICTYHYTPCGCTRIYTPICDFGTDPCGAISPFVGIEKPGDPVEFTREQVATLKQHLQEQIQALDEHAKTLNKK